MNKITLTESTARKIVQQASALIDHCVNVMDKHGVIIASSDPTRLYQRHEGAILAINEKRLVIIDRASVNALHGVKPGINFPITFRDEVIGVIGVSGEEADLSEHARIVQVMAELIIEHLSILNHEQWAKRYKEALITELISPDCDHRSVKNMAAFLDFDLNISRAVVIMRFPSSEKEAYHRLLDSFEKQNVLFTRLESGETLFLQPLQFVKSQRQFKKEQRVIHYLAEYFSAKAAITFYVGGYFEGIEGIYRSYLTSKSLQDYLTKVEDKQTVFFYDNYMLPVLLSGLKTHWQAQELTRRWKILVSHDPKGVYRETLQTYFACHCDLHLTAERLQIHINTLRYRFSRIEELCQLQLNQLDSLLELYVGAILSS